MQYAALAMSAWVAFSWVLGLIEDRALLEQRAERREAEIELISDTQRATEAAREAAGARRLELQRELSELEVLLREVQDATPDTDAPIAPVLRNLLERLPKE